MMTPLLLSAALAAAAPGRCPDGSEPRLTGDAFSPVDCSKTAAPAAALPAASVEPGKAAKAELKRWAGRWEGSVVHGLGRYELALAVKTLWGGGAELTLAVKELQFRDRFESRLALSPAMAAGAYDAALSVDRAPGAVLKGRAAIGLSAGRAGADLVLENGAAHRLTWKASGKDEMSLRVDSAVPGAPLQAFETTLRRAPK